MLNGKRIVVVTPAGRRRYMELLHAHLRGTWLRFGIASSRPLIDRWDLWVNTRDEADLAYLRGIADGPRMGWIVEGTPAEGEGPPIPAGNCVWPGDGLDRRGHPRRWHPQHPQLLSSRLRPGHNLYS